MNQEKTGKFIASLRKDKKMTQEQLAEKMGVSINAVSKWERGLSFPDVSLFKKLCSELNISIEELINGEKDNSDIAKEKAIISTLNEKNKIKTNSRKLIFFIIIFFVIIIAFLLYYNKNLKVNLVNDSDYLYDLSIEFIRDKDLDENPDSNKKDFNSFYSYYGFGIEKKYEYKYVYMWLYNQSYYIEDENVLAVSSGSSIPCKVTFKENKIIKVEYPKDGSYYKKSIKEMFPSIIAIQVLNFDKITNIDKLFNEVGNKKNIYYDYLNINVKNLTLEDISYNDLIFTINIGNRDCIPIQLNLYKNNKYVLFTHYKSCKPGKVCNSILNYTKSITDKYDYDIIEIIRHSIDANNMQFTNSNLPKYEIFTGNGYNFITDSDNRYLNEFLKSIKVDLNECAIPEYS